MLSGRPKGDLTASMRLNGSMIHRVGRVSDRRPKGAIHVEPIPRRVAVVE